MNGKGSRRRPAKVDHRTWAQNYERIFAPELPSTEDLHVQKIVIPPGRRLVEPLSVVVGDERASDLEPNLDRFPRRRQA